MTDEMKKKYKELFDSIVNDLLKVGVFNGITIGNVDLEKKSKYASGKQYAKEVYWFRFLFEKPSPDNSSNDNSFIKKKEYNLVKGIHIMPFCIVLDDVQHAHNSVCCFRSTYGDTYKCNKEKGITCAYTNDNNSSCSRIFNKQEMTYTDLDWSTFNIHKHIIPYKTRYQVVLVTDNGSGKQYGPHSVKDIKGDSISKREFFSLMRGRESHIKTDWYFPEVQENVETCDVSGCLADLRSENLLEKKPIKRLEYLLAVDIVKAMQAVLTENSFQEYLAKIDLNALCALEIETKAFVKYFHNLREKMNPPK